MRICNLPNAYFCETFHGILTLCSFPSAPSIPSTTISLNYRWISESKYSLTLPLGLTKEFPLFWFIKTNFTSKNISFWKKHSTNQQIQSVLKVPNLLIRQGSSTLCPNIFSTVDKSSTLLKSQLHKLHPSRF